MKPDTKPQLAPPAGNSEPGRTPRNRRQFIQDTAPLVGAAAVSAPAVGTAAADARIVLGLEMHPNAMTALGSEFFFDDDQEFPYTQCVVFEYDTGGKRRQLICEHRTWSPYVQEGHENGNAFYGTRGMPILGKQAGWKFFGWRNKLMNRLLGRAYREGHWAAPKEITA